MISLPAPEDPPMIETIKLGVMAINLVIKFLSHFLIFNSKKPYNTMQHIVSTHTLFSGKVKLKVK